jgi:hypothetical protein
MRIFVRIEVMRQSGAVVSRFRAGSFSSHVVEFAGECLHAIRDADRRPQVTNSSPKLFFDTVRRASDRSRPAGDDANASPTHW